jgi:hypothetical protein
VGGSTASIEGGSTGVAAAPRLEASMSHLTGAGRASGRSPTPNVSLRNMAAQTSWEALT